MTRLACVLVFCLSSAAFADAVSVRLNQRAVLGKGLPSVEIRIHEKIAGFRLTLRRSDGEKVDVKGGGRPGQVRTLELAQPEGRFEYQGELVVTFPDGQTGAMPLAFDAELYGPLEVTLRRKDVELEKRRLRFTASRPITHARVQVVMDTGEVAHDAEVPFDQPPAGTPLEITWPRAEGVVLKIAVRAFDAATYYDGFEIFPYEVHVPHEEINFQTGKWEILPSEAPKLEEVLPGLQRRLKRARPWAEVRLYIMGHTDTVGAPEKNRTLSLHRARAIGQWFRKKGVRVPIFYEGFGESAPRVPTQDETDEPRNRRADYILSVEEPTVSGVQPKWRKL